MFNVIKTSYNCNRSVCFNVINIVTSNKVFMGIKTFINQSKTNNQLLVITSVCYFIDHYRAEYAIVDIFAMSLNIMKAINLMISFCISWWRYFCRLFSIQEVMLGSTFALNFINCSKLPSLLFPRKARPWQERNCIFRSMVKDIYLVLAFF